MADNKYNNSITTSLITLFDSSSVQLRISGLENGISIAFWMPSRDPVTGKLTYPKESRYSTIITTDRVATLDRMISELLIPEFEAGRDKSVAVFTNRQKSMIFEIRVINGEFFASLYTDVDPMTLIPKNGFRFKFEKTTAACDYNSESGNMNITEYDGNFYIFTELLHNIIAIGNNKVSGHSVRQANSFTTSSLFEYIRAIAAKMGVTVENRSYSPVNNSPSTSYENTITNTSDPMPEMKELTDITQMLQ